MVDGFDRKTHPPFRRGGCGGTTFGLHCAVNEIQSGGRVLWASPEMPNATRFSQLFASLNIVESSRFHAMNLIGAMDRCVDAIVEAEHSLPRVGLVVLDDWCNPTGRIEKESLAAVIDLAKRIKPETTLLLISKSGTDVTGSEKPIVLVQSRNLNKRDSIFVVCMQIKERCSP